MSEARRLDPWDPEAARAAVQETLGTIDCTACAAGAETAFGDQDWSLTDMTLWWEPGYSPTSFIQMNAMADWVGSGPPKAPSLIAIVRDVAGRLVNIDDVSPYDEWHRVPQQLAYRTNIHLKGSGPSTVPGAIEFRIGDAVDDTFASDDDEDSEDDVS